MRAILVAIFHTFFEEASYCSRVMPGNSKSRGLDRGKLGLVGFSSTIQVAETLLHEDVTNLEKLLPHAAFVHASPLLQEMRMVKSEEEIEMLRKAGKIARVVLLGAELDAKGERQVSNKT
jgi:Xaa-Pro aminopeptidase